MMYAPALAAFLATNVPVAAAPVQAEAASALPDGVRAMIEAAIASGDAKAIETVVRFARETHAFAGGEIDEIAERWRLRLAESEAQKRREQQIALQQGDLFDNWKGQVELGASRSTGRTSYIGVFGSLGVEREGMRWRHKILARAEIQEGRNVTDVERIIASWQPNYKFGDRLYAYGLTQYEADPVQGYDGRYTLGGGLGYAVLNAPTAKLDMEGGPALRHIDQVDDAPYSSIAARASLNFRWAITPTLELKQTSALYLEEGDSNASALTAVEAQLIGPLKGRFSYDVRYEDRLRSGGSQLDTLSRATLVYNF
jgi:putative salt-induced outer membrane protein